MTVALSAVALCTTPLQAGAALSGGALAAATVVSAALAPAILKDRQPAASPPAVLAALQAPSERVIEGRIGRGETLTKALTRHGVPPKTVALIQRKLAPYFDFRRARSGHSYSVTLDPAGKLQLFHYGASRTEHYWVEADNGTYRGWREEAEVRRETRRIVGKVSTSLNDAIDDAGAAGGGRLAQDFAGIFAWDIDFSRGIQPGDQFGILYERTYASQGKGQERNLGPGRILAAEFHGGGGELRAIYFETEPGHGGYYWPNGTSVKGGFLAAPLNYSRITSVFSMARFHPILRRWRPHFGIDYAAPVGTPIWAVANGIVTYAGWMHGYGRLVKVRHANGYETYYAHMSRYAPGLRVGQLVRQKQVIGFVGASGLATGPHVCFRVTKDGHFVDPSRVRIDIPGDRIPQNEWATFQAVRDRRLSELGPAPMVATDEAM